LFCISNLTIEGFRGINSKITIDLDGNSAVLSGPNGVGKSSVMEAIEWCLFGRLISAVIGPVEFKKEDAIVNSFHPKKKAIVEVILEREKGKKVKVMRERKLGRSTTAGKTQLRIEVQGTDYFGNEAQSELNKLLKITPSEFYASVYLRQQTIRDLIVGDPLIRSEVIDKLLGLHLLRELISHLPIKHAAKEAKGIREEIEDIKNRKMQEVVISRKRLGELETEMEKSGVEATKLKLASLAKLIEEVSKDIRTIAQRVKTEVKEIEKPIHDLGSLDKALGQMKKDIDELEKVWANVYREEVANRSTLKNMKQNYEEALEELASLEAEDPKDLVAKKSGISDQISEIETELNGKISAREFAQQESMVIHRLHANLDEARSELDDIEKEFGGKAVIEDTLKKLKSEVDDKKEAIKREESLGSMLVSGLDYLKNTLPKNCPLCKSDIVYQNVVPILEKEISERESAKIVGKLQNESEELARRKTRVESALGDVYKLEDQLESIHSKIDQEKERLRRKGFEPKEDLMKCVDSELVSINTQISNIDKRIRELKSEATLVDLGLRDLKKKMQKMDSLEKQAQELIRTAVTKETLVNLLSERIDDSEQYIKTFESITEDIRLVKGSLEVCERILRFLKDKDRVDQLEKGLPLLQRRLKDLEETYSEIKEVEVALTDIYQAASTAREAMVKKALSELQSAIGSYYSRILCHPYYVNLQLIPEEERKKAIYRIRAWDKDFKQGTYVQTRFSNAQMNAVALSLFLSMSMRLGSNLGLFLLDDPSQSMDKVHKEALSKLLGEILEERQIFVATQDTEFEQCLEKYLNKAKTKIYEIPEWDTKGIQITLKNRSV